MNDPFLDRLVERIFKKRDFGTKTSRENGASHHFPVPFITIARDPGSGGGPIGQEIARRLGFEYYDHELLEEIARRTKLRKETLEQIDERGRTAVQDIIHSVLDPDYISDMTYVRQLSRVMLSLAYKGNVVILGRGANYITPRSSGLHVRITAPLSVRIERAMMFEGHTKQKAKEIITKHERDRREFVYQYLGKNIADPLGYDLVLNTEDLTLSQSVDIILAAFNKKFPTPLQKISSSLLKR